ncbi:MAG: zinc ribbon domain-containing protein [Candidatus Hydrothermota bacterium]|nr:MAG: zinc ribbon domain-containing protein [Candidatus Hydrothermae bacterium]
MPLYEYRCKQCGYIFEELVAPGEPEPKRCPKCGGEVERMFSRGVGFVFKGSGFYITDYKRKEDQKKQEKSSKKEDSGSKD